MTDISFGDRVRVRRMGITAERELAGLVGQVYGHTTPSVTGVTVIGEPSSDLAFNVHFDDLDAAYWFAPDLLEFVDHAHGTEIQVGDTRLVRDAFGEWQRPDGKKKRWWRRR